VPSQDDAIIAQRGSLPAQPQAAQKRRSRLGTIAKTVSTQVGGRRNGHNSFRNRAQNPRRKKKPTPEELSQARVRKFGLQSVAARIVPEQLVAKCLRHKIPVARSVEVGCVPATHSAHYGKLQLCASVWACPICAGSITERRRDELAKIVKKHIEAGGSVYMTTYTVSHKRYDDLGDLVGHFLAARRKMRQGRNGQALRKKFNIVGTVSVLEVTWSERNGWHPHVHELVFCGGELDAEGYEAFARSAWRRAAEHEGLEMNEHGFKLDRTYGAVADYVAKFGRDPATDRVWGVESEMTKGHLKQGRGPADDPGMTPFAMLAAIYDQERCDLEPKFREYATVFKGRKQLNYSPGLKAMYQEAEKTDEEIINEHEHQSVVLAELQDEQWEQVLGNDARGELLESARTCRPGVVLNFLQGLGAPVYPEQFMRFEGWRVLTPAGAATVASILDCPILKRWRCSVVLDEPVDGSAWKAFDFVDIEIGELSIPEKEPGDPE
jgi:hypothetical protein